MAKVLKILNHDLTPAQIKELEDEVFLEYVEIEELPEHLRGELLNTPSDEDALKNLARRVVEAAFPDNFSYAGVIFPAGSPAFMWLVARFCKVVEENAGVYPRYLFSHSERQVVEEKLEDGRVIKKSIFQHKKWIVL